MTQPQFKKNTHITMLTAYDALTAEIVANAGVDMVLVGDSLGSVFCGDPDTLSVTMDQMVYHTKAVRNGANDAFIVADMPALSVSTATSQTKENAQRLIQEGKANAVKVEVKEDAFSISPIRELGIPVMAHIGFTPQHLEALGGYKVQGRKEQDQMRLLALAQDAEKAGAFALVLEMIPSALAKKITQSVGIPTIGIGAGPDVDGQVLVTADLIGLNTKKMPKFVKTYANVSTVMASAIQAFKREVVEKKFPEKEHGFEA